MTKNAFDLVPNLRETFDLLKKSSEIRSSDQLPLRTDIDLGRSAFGYQSNRNEKIIGDLIKRLPLCLSF